MSYDVQVVSAEPGRVVATADYPADQRNYWLALEDGGDYEVYRVLQDFNGVDSPQPIEFEDTAFAKIEPGAYTLSLRERYRCRGHDMCWRTRASAALTVPS